MPHIHNTNILPWQSMTAGEMWSVSELPCAARVARRCPLGHVYSLDGFAIHHPVLRHARVKWGGKLSQPIGSCVSNAYHTNKSIFTRVQGSHPFPYSAGKNTRKYIVTPPELLRSNHTHVCGASEAKSNIGITLSVRLSVCLQRFAFAGATALCGKLVRQNSNPLLQYKSKRRIHRCHSLRNLRNRLKFNFHSHTTQERHPWNLCFIF